MNRLFFLLSQIVLGPYHLVRGLFDAPNELFHSSQRGRALVLGLPALIVATLGVSALVWAFNGDQQRLEARYNDDLDEIRASISERKETFVSKRLSIDSENEQEVAELKSLQDEIDALVEKARIYLEKLISLDPDSYLYRYQLALMVQESSKPNAIAEAYALMGSIAPDDEPLYEDAHLWLSKYHLLAMRATQDANLRRRNYDLALKHADYCLARNRGNLEANALKAGLLEMPGRNYDEPYAIYETLFDQQPRFYDDLYRLNNKIADQQPDQRDRIERRQQLMLETAADKYYRLVRTTEFGEDAGQWASNLENYIKILVRLNRYDDAIEALEEKERSYRQKLTSGTEPEVDEVTDGRHVTIRVLLAQVYQSQVASIQQQIIDSPGLSAEEKSELQFQQLELLRKALFLRPNSAETLQQLARLTTGDSPVAAEARKVYDPLNDPNAPAAVLNELGTTALQSGEYSKAIDFFSRAYEQMPNDGTLMNNLAYAYLVSENPQPELALQLVDRAIQLLPRVQDPQKREQYASSYYDTRGCAQLELDRPQEAVVSFERALQTRPNAINILEGLESAYTRLQNEDQAEIYRKRIEELRKKEQADGGQG